MTEPPGAGGFCVAHIFILFFCLFTLVIVAFLFVFVSFSFYALPRGYRSLLIEDGFNRNFLYHRESGREIISFNK